MSQVACVAAEQVSDPEFRHELFVRQRLAGRAILVGERNNKLYGVSLFRDEAAGFYSQPVRAAIQSLADTLISCVAKHTTRWQETQGSVHCSFQSESSRPASPQFHRR